MPLAIDPGVVSDHVESRSKTSSTNDYILRTLGPVGRTMPTLGPGWTDSADTALTTANSWSHLRKHQETAST
jgi:hypothetical protein